VLKVPNTLTLEYLTPEEFETHVLKMANSIYQPYGTILHKFTPQTSTPATERELRDLQRDK
jgi:hypothetical protein